MKYQKISSKGTPILGFLVKALTDVEKVINEFHFEKARIYIFLLPDWL